MQTIEDKDLGHLSDFNAQMLGATDDQIIDVTAESDSISKSDEISRKKKKRLIAGAAAAVGVVAFGGWLSLSSKPVAPQNPAVDAVLLKHTTHQSAMVDLPVLPASSVPAVMPANQNVNQNSNQSLSIASDVLSVSAPVVAPVTSDEKKFANGVTTKSLDPHSVTTPAPAAPASKPDSAPDNQQAMRQLNDKIQAMEKEIANRDSAYKDLVAKNLLREKLEKQAAAKSVADKKTVVQSKIVGSKPESKTARTISAAKSGISVLMEKGLIYSSNSDYVELKIGDNFPGYGRLIRVDRIAKTFETSTGAYVLKD